MAQNFKVNQLSKDLGIKTKEITDLLTAHGVPAKSQSTLEADEFGLFMHLLTKENQAVGIEDYIDGIAYIPSKKKEKTAAKAEVSEVKAAAEKPAETKTVAAKAETAAETKSEKAPEAKPEAKKEEPVKKEPVKQEEPVFQINYVAECEKQLSKQLGRGVKIVNGKRKGRFELEFYGQEDLQNLLDLLMKLEKG